MVQLEPAGQVESMRTPDGTAGEAHHRPVSNGDGPVTKALQLLDVVADAAVPLRFSDLNGKLPFPKATLHRMLKSLVTERMLSHHPVHGTYQLGPRLIKLAHASWSHGSLQDVSRPVLDALHSQLQRTIHLAQLDDGQVLYLDKRVANHGPAMFSKPGKIGPGYCTGVGKAMLAFLPTSALEEAIQQQTFRAHTPQTIVNPDALREELDTIRLRGFAFDREEHEPGIICIAVPILSDDGQLFGAISATGPGSAAEVEELAALAPALQQAARHIASDATIRMAPTLS